MTTPMPASPFLSESRSASSNRDAVTLGADPIALEGVTAEIPLASSDALATAAASTSEPGAAEPAVAFQPPAIAGTNSASVRDRIELHDIGPHDDRDQSSGTGASDKLTGRRFSERMDPQGELTGVQGETKRVSSHWQSSLAEPETKARPNDLALNHAEAAPGIDHSDPLAYGEFNCLTASDEALYWKLVIADHPSTPDLPEIPDPEALWEAIDRPLFLETFKLGEAAE